jgi:type IX secretion system PorP/SprF family membrane protein
MWSCATVFAQDPHFSIFNGISTALNPAATGNFNGTFRVGAQYREQWSSVLANEAISAYKTTMASIEYRTQEGFGDKDLVGIGAQFMYDAAGQSRLTNTKYGVSLAYRKALDEYGDNFLSVGGQAAIVQKNINISDLTWGTQWDGTKYDALLPSKEGVILDNLTFYDFSAGLAWGYNVYNSRNRFYAGLSFLHLNQPDASFRVQNSSGGTSSAQIPMRINFSGGMGLQLSERLDILPKVLFMKQGQSIETIVGGDVRFLIDPSDSYSNSLYIGALIRGVGGDSKLIGDATGKLNAESFIITGKAEINDMEIGAAYDFNISPLSVASKYQGGFEIYINYIFKVESHRQSRLFCPKL